VLLFLSWRWKCGGRKLPPLTYSLDWSFYRDGRLIGFGEFKARDCESRRYKTTYVSLLKAWKARELALLTGRPAFFIVLFTDGLFYAPFPIDGEALVTFNGNSRGQDGDREEVLHLPREAFRKIDAERC